MTNSALFWSYLITVKLLFEILPNFGELWMCLSVKILCSLIFGIKGCCLERLYD